MQTHKNFIFVKILSIIALLLLNNTNSAAQEKTNPLAEASDRLLDAVDTRDFSKVKMLLSSDLGRSLARHPVGLLAAGRAVENSYYEIAHYILAVRNQQKKSKKDEALEEQKRESGPLQGGFLSSKPRILLKTRQHELPKTAPINKNIGIKNKSNLDRNTGLSDMTVSFSNAGQIYVAPKNTSLNNHSSPTNNPFDPSNIPSTTLPPVK